MKARSFTTADVEAVVSRLGDRLGGATPTAIELREEHSNLVAEVELDIGRTLIIKQARYPEMAARFETSRTAARLLRQRTRVVVPEYLDVPGPNSTLAYWRIPLPTLEELWPGLREQALRHTLRTLGGLIRRIQQVRLPGHGALLEVERARSATEFLLFDLRQRLRPAAAGHWRAALPTIDELVDRTRGMQARVDDREAVLVHNDLFAPNILCEQMRDGEVVCVGAIDFEDAFAGPPEAEFAKIEVLHGPLFGRPQTEQLMREIVTGHGGPLDPLVMAYFRAFHLLNMGFHAAATGHDGHAAEVLDACWRELHALDRLATQ
ncbi:MAG TPA: aminoglycoside phosphotransferase family protein [Enhygromyxa sp.]|nr:aminoglycoside phosphotransferase family protein [Enhygromyxa sp.]